MNTDMSLTTSIIVAATLLTGCLWLLWCRWLDVRKQEDDARKDIDLAEQKRICEECVCNHNCHNNEN